MPPNIAFQSLTIEDGAEGRILHVTGFSSDGGSLSAVQRHVAIKAGAHVVRGPTSDGLQSWEADIPIPDDFPTGEAYAIGIETQLISCTDNPMFATLTWSDTVEIE